MQLVWMLVSTEKRLWGYNVITDSQSHTEWLRRHKVKQHNVQGDEFVEIKYLSHQRVKWDAPGPSCDRILDWITTHKETVYRERVNSRNSAFTPYRITPCVFLQSHFHFTQGEKAKSKAPLLQSTTRVSAAFSRRGFEVNRTVHAKQETQYNMKEKAVRD